MPLWFRSPRTCSDALCCWLARGHPPGAARSAERAATSPLGQRMPDGTGGSRAAKRRARHRSQAQSVVGSAGKGRTAAAAAPALPTLLLAPPARSEPGPPVAREWTVPLPSRDDVLSDGLQIALAQARLVQGHKYRYGATLLAGDDCIPLRTGSNKKIFNRDNIHAEVSALKGCVAPCGKDMLIVRLAPAPPPTEAAVAAAAGGLCRNEKFLNARPCAACELKMVSRGLRRCFFTLPGGEMGVMDLQLPATRPPRMEAAYAGDPTNCAGTAGERGERSDGGDGTPRDGPGGNGGAAACRSGIGGGGRSAADGTGEGGLLRLDGPPSVSGIEAQRDRPTGFAAGDSPSTGASEEQAEHGQNDSVPWGCVTKFEPDAPFLCIKEDGATLGRRKDPSGSEGNGSCPRRKKRNKSGGGGPGGGARPAVAATQRGANN